MLHNWTCVISCSRGGVGEMHTLNTDHNNISLTMIDNSWLDLLWFYGIPTIVSYLMLSSVYTYILNIHNLICFYGIPAIVSYLILFTNPSARAGYDTRSIFKWSLTGLKSEFSFLPLQGWTAQFTLLFTHSWRENNWIHTFPKGISAMWNAISLVQDLNSCHRVHFIRR